MMNRANDEWTMSDAIFIEILAVVSMIVTCFVMWFTADIIFATKTLSITGIIFSAVFFILTVSAFILRAYIKECLDKKNEE